MRIVFQTARWGIQKTPAWLLRFRPFNVYEIRLPTSDLADADRSSSSPSPNAGTNSNAVVDVATSQTDSIRIDWASAEQMSELTALSPPCLLDSACSRSRAVVAWQHQTAIGITWIASEFFDDEELGLKVELRDDEAWLFASHVLAAHRRKGVYSKLLSFVLAELATQGKTRLLLGTTRGNEPSRKAHEGMGARIVGSIFAARILLRINFASVSGNIELQSSAISLGTQAGCKVRVSQSVTN